jgi:hypothetical protein
MQVLPMAETRSTRCAHWVMTTSGFRPGHRLNMLFVRRGSSVHNFHVQMKFLNQYLRNFVLVSKVNTQRGLNVPNHLNVSNCRLAPELNTSCSEKMSAPLTRSNYCSPTEQHQPKTSLHGVKKVAPSTSCNLYGVHISSPAHGTGNLEIRFLWVYSVS